MLSLLKAVALALRRVENIWGGILLLRPSLHTDERGYFFEVFRNDDWQKLHLPNPPLQENQSLSRRGVIRGLHFQWDPPMAKLMRVTRGRACLVAVDIRPGSATLGKWYGVEVSAENHLQVFAPAGFARGFCALSDWAEVQYLCTAEYNPAGESGIRWNDPEIGIQWPDLGQPPILSAKDAAAQTLRQWLARPEAESFRYTAVSGVTP